MMMSRQRSAKGTYIIILENRAEMNKILWANHESMHLKLAWLRKAQENTQTHAEIIPKNL